MGYDFSLIAKCDDGNPDSFERIRVGAELINYGLQSVLYGVKRRPAMDSEQSMTR